MTFMPALGTLIHVPKTEDVAAANAATYPIALISVVLAAQFIIILILYSKNERHSLFCKKEQIVSSVLLYLNFKRR